MNQQEEQIVEVYKEQPRTPTRPHDAKPVERIIIAKPKQDKPPEVDMGIWKMSRRGLLSLAAWVAVLGTITTGTVAFIRFLFPRVLYEPPTAFRAGLPGEYTVGTVSERFKDLNKVWIIREASGFYALISICTHLGCTPRWLQSENKFKCPCHGSGFRPTGINFEGPAPRPLERCKISLADDGQLQIDRSKKFLFEKGEWGQPGSYLEYS